MVSYINNMVFHINYFGERKIYKVRSGENEKYSRKVTLFE